MGTVVGKKVTAGGKTTYYIEIEDDPNDECVQHIKDAHNKNPRVYHTGGNSKKNRAASLKNYPTKSNLDRDEWPMACMQEGGAGASVRYIDPSDNRSMGSRIGAILRDAPPGSEIHVSFV